MHAINFQPGSREPTSAMSSQAESLSSGPLSSQGTGGPSGLPPYQHFPTDMDVDVEDALELHDAPGEKTDTDFFNDFADDFDLADVGL